MSKIDLNSDLGESFGAYQMGRDDQVLASVSSANVACGFHAGDPMVMVKTVKLAAQHSVAVGAHPGYPDLVGFGRRAMKCSPEEGLLRLSLSDRGHRRSLSSSGDRAPARQAPRRHGTTPPPRTWTWL